MRKLHRTVIAYAAGHLYARCNCGWEGAHRPIAYDSIGNDHALRAADRECDHHLEQVKRNEHAE